MNEHASTCIESILNESVASREVFKKIFIVHIVDLDLLVCELFEECLVQCASQDRQHMSDLGGLQ
jgi:hypothetical protein